VLKEICRVEGLKIRISIEPQNGSTTHGYHLAVESQQLYALKPSSLTAAIGFIPAYGGCPLSR
jgi:hypothetical protein